LYQSLHSQLNLVLVYITILRTTIATLFPYTTLFRSYLIYDADDDVINEWLQTHKIQSTLLPFSITKVIDNGAYLDKKDIKITIRSEEHTSELQSRENLVCRLLLEKKKKKV